MTLRQQAELLGVKIGIFRNGMSAFDYEWEADRCWHQYDILKDSGHLNLWGELAEILEQRADNERFKAARKRAAEAAVTPG